ncbi:hypothetical protein CONLIGDRAFT_686209 [Coniochaeta ligniaria NRRL 30616]|uniref:Uncharacterized protein n=1 Tax=Coniochaeta ligniaria NRRL 30616 TaxID=1408157 RepID=A0A1J7J8Z1_9PEZI|nr:hypothetical protein CONLIGDRAFT_686209 [Coniochaeta ligniaria NRRL 30616]
MCRLSRTKCVVCGWRAGYLFSPCFTAIRLRVCNSDRDRDGSSDPGRVSCTTPELLPSQECAAPRLCDNCVYEGVVVSLSNNQQRYDEIVAIVKTRMRQRRDTGDTWVFASMYGMDFTTHNNTDSTWQIPSVGSTPQGHPFPQYWAEYMLQDVMSLESNPTERLWDALTAQNELENMDPNLRDHEKVQETLRFLDLLVQRRGQVYWECRARKAASRQLTAWTRRSEQPLYPSWYTGPDRSRYQRPELWTWKADQAICDEVSRNGSNTAVWCNVTIHWFEMIELKPLSLSPTREATATGHSVFMNVEGVTAGRLELLGLTRVILDLSMFCYCDDGDTECLCSTFMGACWRQIHGEFLEQWCYDQIALQTSSVDITTPEHDIEADISAPNEGQGG